MVEQVRQGHSKCIKKKADLWVRQGMNVARLNMSHGDHKSHKAVVDLVREYNRLDRGNVAIMLDTKGPEVRSGDLAEPIDMKPGALLPSTPQSAATGGMLFTMWPEVPP